jgi:hypothetical protein
VSAQLSEEEVAQWMIENNSVDSNFGSNSVPSSVVTTFLCCGRCHQAVGVFKSFIFGVFHGLRNSRE